MIQYTTVIKKFGSQGEKTGWTYIDVPAAMAQQLKPDTKTSYRVKGQLDGHIINQVALIPMGGGDYIMPLNATMRKQIRKGKGDSLHVQLEVDTRPLLLSGDLLDCLADEPKALDNFKRLPPSHQNYYTRWIESAKTEATKAKRIALTVSALSKAQSFGEMIREQKANKTDLMK